MTDTDKKRERLKAIIKTKSYITGGDFKLASGANSNFFFDLKTTMLDPEGASLAADLILDRIANDKVKAIGGLVLGACPIASAVCVKSFERGTPVSAFYVRKEPKQRGTQKLIEGSALEPGNRVVVVEDVTTSGGSALKAAEVVQSLDAEVVKIITLVDREQGAKDMLAEHGLKLESLFSKKDFE